MSAVPCFSFFRGHDTQIVLTTADSKRRSGDRRERRAGKLPILPVVAVMVFFLRDVVVGWEMNLVLQKAREQETNLGEGYQVPSRAVHDSQDAGKNSWCRG